MGAKFMQILTKGRGLLRKGSASATSPSAKLSYRPESATSHERGHTLWEELLREATLKLYVDSDRPHTLEAARLLTACKGEFFADLRVYDLKGNKAPEIPTPQLVTPVGLFRGLEEIKYVIAQEKKRAAAHAA